MIADLLTSMLPARAGTRREYQNAVLENPAYSPNDPAAWELFRDSQNMSDAGLNVTHRHALNLGVVWQCVSTISGDIASMPLNILKENETTGWHEIDWSNPAQPLISIQPNEETSAFDFWRRLMVHALLWGNGYGYIERRARRGPPVSLTNLLPDRTAPKRAPDGSLFYVTEVDGTLEPLFAEEVFHLKGPSIENGHGHDMVRAARNAIGLAMAAEGYSSKFFANGAQASGILMIPAAFTEPAAQKLEEMFRKRAQKDSWFKTMIVRDGAKWESVSIDAQKAQLHELREDQVRDMARFFNMPGFKVNLPDSVGYNSSEMAQTVYLMMTLLHWMKAIHGETRLKLLDRKIRLDGSHRIMHDTTELLKPDAKTHATVLEIERRNEIINANEWRRETGRNPRTDPGGEEFVNPNVKSGGDTEPDEPAPTKKTDTKKLAADIGGIVNDCLAPRFAVIQDGINNRFIELKGSFSESNAQLCESFTTTVGASQTAIVGVISSQSESLAGEIKNVAGEAADAIHSFKIDGLVADVRSLVRATLDKFGRTLKDELGSAKSVKELQEWINALPARSVDLAKMVHSQAIVFAWIKGRDRDAIGSGICAAYLSYIAAAATDAAAKSLDKPANEIRGAVRDAVTNSLPAAALSAIKVTE